MPGGRVARLGAGDVEAERALVAVAHRQPGDLGAVGRVPHGREQRADADRVPLRCSEFGAFGQARGGRPRPRRAARDHGSGAARGRSGSRRRRRRRPPGPERTRWPPGPATRGSASPRPCGRRSPGSAPASPSRRPPGTRRRAPRHRGSAARRSRPARPARRPSPAAARRPGGRAAAPSARGRWRRRSGAVTSGRLSGSVSRPGEPLDDRGERGHEGGVGHDVADPAGGPGGGAGCRPSPRPTRSGRRPSPARPARRRSTPTYCRSQGGVSVADGQQVDVELDPVEPLAGQLAQPGHLRRERILAGLRGQAEGDRCPPARPRARAGVRRCRRPAPGRPGVRRAAQRRSSSATWSTRSANVPNGRPSSAASPAAAGRPARRPSSNRWPDSRSSVAACQATSTGRAVRRGQDVAADRSGPARRLRPRPARRTAPGRAGCRGSTVSRSRGTRPAGRSAAHCSPSRACAATIPNRNGLLLPMPMPTSLSPARLARASAARGDTRRTSAGVRPPSQCPPAGQLTRSMTSGSRSGREPDGAMK